MTFKRVSVGLDEETLAQVDRLRGDVARERWMRDAIEDRVESERVQANLPEEPQLGDFGWRRLSPRSTGSGAPR